MAYRWEVTINGTVYEVSAIHGDTAASRTIPRGLNDMVAVLHRREKLNKEVARTLKTPRRR